MKPLRVAFVMDQQVGLKTQSLNLQHFVAEDVEIEPIWIPVHYEKPAGFLSRLPGVPGSIRGSLRGVAEIRDGFRSAGNWDAALWATWAAKSVPDLVARKPSFLRMDMTPTQMEAMGAQYGYTKRRAHFLGNWKRRATQRIYSQATHFFPWNDWVGQSLQDEWKVPADKITSISPGVNTDLFYPDKSVRPNDGVTRILFVGGDFVRKGGDLLLRWASTEGKRLRAMNYPWEIHIVTRDSPETGTITGLHFHRGIANNSPELIGLYQKSDLFILPTQADCYSLVAMEAMACGLPVIITALGGIGEIVTTETGFLLDATNETKRADQLTHALDTLIRDPESRRAMGECGRERVGNVLDAHSCVQTLLAKIKSFA